MGFVGAFVGAESCVAVEAIGAVFYGKPGHVAIVGSDGSDKVFAEGVPFFLYLFISAFIVVEPFAVVVDFDVFQKIDDFFHMMDCVSVSRRGRLCIEPTFVPGCLLRCLLQRGCGIVFSQRVSSCRISYHSIR